MVQLRHMLHSRDTVNFRGTVHVCGPVNVRVTECRIQPEEHDTASLADSVCGQLILFHRSFGRGGRPYLFAVKHVGLVKNQKRLIGTSLKSSGVRQQSSGFKCCWKSPPICFTLAGRHAVALATETFIQRLGLEGGDAVVATYQGMVACFS